MRWKPKPLSYRKPLRNPQHREPSLPGVLAFLFVLLLCILGAIIGGLVARFRF